MIRISLGLSTIAIALSGCVSEPAPTPTATPAYVGDWNCEGAVIEVRENRFGSDAIRVRKTDDRNFTAIFNDGNTLGFGVVTATGMTLVPGDGKPQVTCTRG
jgi:hypothetical protein